MSPGKPPFFKAREIQMGTEGMWFLRSLSLSPLLPDSGNLVGTKGEKSCLSVCLRLYLLRVESVYPDKEKTFQKWVDKFVSSLPTFRWQPNSWGIKKLSLFYKWSLYWTRGVAPYVNTWLHMWIPGLLELLSGSSFKMFQGDNSYFNKKKTAIWTDQFQLFLSKLVSFAS